MHMMKKMVGGVISGGPQTRLETLTEEKQSNLDSEAAIDEMSREITTQDNTFQPAEASSSLIALQQEV